MKKAISLLLALMLCLSLCACGGGNDAPETKGNEEIDNPIENQVETTEDPALEAEREKQYNIALRKLETSVFDGQSAAFKEAYEIFAQLGDYKDAQAHLEKYTILPDMRLMETCSEVNAFGEEVNSCSRDYGYDAEGKTVYDPKDCSTPYDSTTRTIYTYNEEGVVIEEVRISGTMTVQKTSITHDEVGNVIKKESLDADGTTTTQTFDYDAMGRLETMMEVLVVEPYGDTYKVTSKYTYDDNGVLVSVVEKGDGGTETTEYAYDANGNLLTETITLDLKYGPDQETVKSYFYENGVLVRVEENSGENSLIVITYTYGDYYCYTPEN